MNAHRETTAATGAQQRDTLLACPSSVFASLLLALLQLTGCSGDGDKSPDSGAVSDGSTPSPADAGSTGLCTSCGACEETFPITSGRHVAGGIDYPDVPPAGGNHDPCWKAFGAYTSEVPDERWVHSLEHGGVVFVHHCEGEPGCDEAATQLGAFAERHPMVLVSPYEALPAAYAVVAWGFRLVSDCYDAKAFAAFYDAHVDNAPESISGPPSAEACPP